MIEGDMKTVSMCIDDMWDGVSLQSIERKGERNLKKILQFQTLLFNTIKRCLH